MPYYSETLVIYYNKRTESRLTQINSEDRFWPSEEHLVPSLTGLLTTAHNKTTLMKKTIFALSGLTLAGLSSASAQIVEIVEPTDKDKVCYTGEADRWEDDGNGNLVLKTTFTQIAPGNPNAPASFEGSFDIDYTGTAPVQNVTADFLNFSFDPADTTVSLPGIMVPDTILVGKEEWDLCHTCYDFDFTTNDKEGLIFKVYDGVTKSEIKTDTAGRYTDITGPVTFKVTDRNGATVGTKGSTYTVAINNVEVCYCAVPEPSTASLGLLALGALMTRRKR